MQGTLEAKENLIDSKREVDNQLKKSCETFIDYVCEELFGQIRQLVKQVNFNSSHSQLIIKDTLIKPNINVSLRLIQYCK